MEAAEARVNERLYYYLERNKKEQALDD